MFRALIIEDEKDAQNLLSKLINEYCVDVELVGIASNIKDGQILIEKEHPDILFLDIQLGHENGFDLLDILKNRPFKIVFTTAFEQYALKAFKYDATDYLLKPYSPKDVIAAVEKVKKRQYDETMYNRLEYLVKNGLDGNKQRISINTKEGVSYFEVDDISHVEADRSYCFIYTSDGQKTLVSKPLKEFESILPMDKFFRTHTSHLVNKKYVEKYVNEDGGYALLQGGIQVPVSRRRKVDFLSSLK